MSNAANSFWLIRDHFRDWSSHHFLESGAAEIYPEFEVVWNSEDLRKHLLEIAKEHSEAHAEGEFEGDDGEKSNDFIDARLALLPWCDIARALAPLDEDSCDD